MRGACIAVRSLDVGLLHLLGSRVRSPVHDRLGYIGWRLYGQDWLHRRRWWHGGLYRRGGWDSRRRHRLNGRRLALLRWVITRVVAFIWPGRDAPVRGVVACISAVELVAARVRWAFSRYLAVEAVLGP